MRESQVPTKPGLAKRSHGESNRSGNRPTANVSPFSQEAVSRILRRREVANPPGGGTRTSRTVCADLPPTGAVVLWFLTAPRLQQLNLSYPVDVRDSAKSGSGPKESRRLNDLAESTLVNVRGCPATEGPAVGPRHRGSVGAVIVVGGWESQPHGEGRQSARSISAKVTDETGGIVAMNVGEMQRSLRRPKTQLDWQRESPVP